MDYYKYSLFYDKCKIRKKSKVKLRSVLERKRKNKKYNKAHVTETVKREKIETLEKVVDEIISVMEEMQNRIVHLQTELMSAKQKQQEAEKTLQKPIETCHMNYQSAGHDIMRTHKCESVASSRLSTIQTETSQWLSDLPIEWNGRSKVVNILHEWQGDNNSKNEMEHSENIRSRQSVLIAKTRTQYLKSKMVQTYGFAWWQMLPLVAYRDCEEARKLFRTGAFAENAYCNVCGIVRVDTDTFCLQELCAVCQYTGKECDGTTSQLQMFQNDKRNGRVFLKSPVYMNSESADKSKRENVRTLIGKLASGQDYHNASILGNLAFRRNCVEKMETTIHESKPLCEKGSCNGSKTQAYFGNNIYARDAIPIIRLLDARSGEFGDFLLAELVTKQKSSLQEEIDDIMIDVMQNIHNNVLFSSPTSKRPWDRFFWTFLSLCLFTYTNNAVTKKLMEKSTLFHTLTLIPMCYISNVEKRSQNFIIIECNL